jgi:hypothetical protein
MIASFAAALLLSAAPAAMDGQTSPQTQTAIPPADATDLGDIVVEGRRLDAQVETFVREVAQPAHGRGLARWHDSVCAGVVNLRAETAQYIVDRVQTVAQDIGLRTGAPGCTPNVMVIATADAGDFTRQFVSEHRSALIGTGVGMDLGYSGLRRFQATERPVRWWNTSMPVDGDTGMRAMRLSGDGLGGVGQNSALGYGPQTQIRHASRLSTQIVDESTRVYIIVDIDKISNVSLTQLGDYIAMVSLAQINPDADTSGYATVLNVFDDPEQTQGLTQWDQAYLQGLYDTQRTRENRNSGRGEVASSIVRAHHRITAGADGQDGLDD